MGGEGEGERGDGRAYTPMTLRSNPAEGGQGRSMDGNWGAWGGGDQGGGGGNIKGIRGDTRRSNAGVGGFRMEIPNKLAIVSGRCYGV